MWFKVYWFIHTIKNLICKAQYFSTNHNKSFYNNKKPCKIKTLSFICSAFALYTVTFNQLVNIFENVVNQSANTSSKLKIQKSDISSFIKSTKSQYKSLKVFPRNERKIQLLSFIVLCFCINLLQISIWRSLIILPARVP